MATIGASAMCVPGRMGSCTCSWMTPKHRCCDWSRSGSSSLNPDTAKRGSTATGTVLPPCCIRPANDQIGRRALAGVAPLTCGRVHAVMHTATGLLACYRAKSLHCNGDAGWHPFSTTPEHNQLRRFAPCRVCDAPKATSSTSGSGHCGCAISHLQGHCRVT